MPAVSTTSMAPINLIIRGTTDSNGRFQNTIRPCPCMVGKCSVRLASFYVEGTDSYEIKLDWGGCGQSYDTETQGVTQTLLMNTNSFAQPSTVFRDIPQGPQTCTVGIYDLPNGDPVSNIGVRMQLEIIPDRA